jgi:hypothetical protein
MHLYVVIEWLDLVCRALPGCEHRSLLHNSAAALIALESRAARVAYHRGEIRDRKRKETSVMRFAPHAVRTATLLAAFALVAAACNARAGGGSAADASIGFVTPSDGATVSVPFDVELKASEPLGDPSTGNRHAHIYFDTGTDAADYDIVYGTTWQVTRDLAPGEHTLTVALANPDHSLAGPTQQITITVSGSGGSPSEGASPSSAPPNRY